MRDENEKIRALFERAKNGVTAFIKGIPPYIRGDAYFPPSPDKSTIYTDADGKVWSRSYHGPTSIVKNVLINDPNIAHVRVSREQMSGSDQALYDLATYAAYGSGGAVLFMVGVLIGAA